MILSYLFTSSRTSPPLLRLLSAVSASTLQHDYYRWLCDPVVPLRLFSASCLQSPPQPCSTTITGGCVILSYLSASSRTSPPFLRLLSAVSASTLQHDYYRWLCDPVLPLCLFSYLSASSPPPVCSLRLNPAARLLQVAVQLMKDGVY